LLVKKKQKILVNLQLLPTALLQLIAFELAGEDRDRRETPVFCRLKIAFFALHKRG
jgi:hypothetical protein